MKQIKQVASSAVLSGALLAMAGSLMMMAHRPVAAQDVAVRRLTVTGQGRESIQTTLAEVGLGVRVEGATATRVQQALAQKADALIAFLRDRAVSDLQTTGIRLEPQYRFSEGVRAFVGYTGSNTVSFEVPTEQAGQVLDGAIAAGANEIQYINFKASDGAIAAAREQALVAATADAQRQAEAVLQALNLAAAEIIAISIGGAGNGVAPVFITRAAANAAESVDIETPIVGGEQMVEARVTLEIRY